MNGGWSSVGGDGCVVCGGLKQWDVVYGRWVMKERQCRLGESECGWMEWWMVVCGGGWDECDDFDRAVTVLACSGRVPCGETGRELRETVCGGWMIVDGWGHHRGCFG